uniref:Uncharacterized protein LOC114334435 n=1 Tax=Diabrotica virgifera virgifera TaxID=50390 RepID=A0A6P7G5T1_DIAVI
MYCALSRQFSSLQFLLNLAIMYDILAELSMLSETLQNRETTELSMLSETLQNRETTELSMLSETLQNRETTELSMLSETLQNRETTELSMLSETLQNRETTDVYADKLIRSIEFFETLKEKPGTKSLEAYIAEKDGNFNNVPITNNPKIATINYKQLITSVINNLTRRMFTT